MEKLSELIEALTQYIKNQNALTQQSHFLTTEVIAIIAAILSFGGLVFTTIYTIRQNSKLQNANARVEWIQKVRDVTAEIISTYSSALNEDDSNKVQKIIIEVREKVERLILFFGHETISCKEIDILDRNTNEGKNDLIVGFLTELSNDFIIYNENVKKGILTQAEARLGHVSSKLHDIITGISSYEEVDIDGENFTNIEYEFDEKVENEYNRAQIRVDEIKKFNRELDMKLVKLRDIIRTYLKIEWNKAKNGK